MLHAATETQIAMSEQLDESLLEILTKGRPVISHETGEEVGRSVPSAADFNAIISRLKQCGVATVPNEKNAIGNVVKKLRLAGAMPAVDEEEDDYATRAA